MLEVKKIIYQGAFFYNLSCCMSQIWNTPWETKIMISTFSPLQLLTVVTSIAEVSLLNYTK